MQAQILHSTTYNGIVGAVLRGRREFLKLEQADMAAQLGLTQSSYSRMENGKTSLTLVQLSGIAPILKFSSSEFLKHVEKIRSDMERQGISVSPEKEPIISEGITNILLGTALLAVVTQMMRR